MSSQTILIACNNEIDLVQVYSRIYEATYCKNTFKCVHFGCIAAVAAVCKVDKSVFTATWLAMQANKKSVRTFLENLLPVDAHHRCARRIILVVLQGGRPVTKRRWNHRSELIDSLVDSVHVYSSFERLFGSTHICSNAWAARNHRSICHNTLAFVIDHGQDSAANELAFNVPSHTIGDILKLEADLAH